MTLTRSGMRRFASWPASDVASPTRPPKRRPTRPPTRPLSCPQAHIAEPRLARLAATVADPTRARTLLRLLDGRLHTAGELARHAGVTPATMSAHLKLLVDEGLARLQPQGRQRYFGLADDSVAQGLEALLRLADGLANSTASAGPAADLRRWQRPAMQGLRRARTCYGHLAGELGVRLHHVLRQRGWVQGVQGVLGVQQGSGYGSLWRALHSCPWRNTSTRVQTVATSSKSVDTTSSAVPASARSRSTL